MLKKTGMNVGFIKAYRVLLITITAFSMIMVGCSSSKPKSSYPTSGGDGNGGAVHLGEILKLGGQVYVANFDEKSVTYSKFTGLAGFVYSWDNYVVVGLVNDGKLQCEMNPGMIHFLPAGDMTYLFYDYDGEYTQLSKDVRFGWVDVLFNDEVDFYRGYFSNVKTSSITIEYVEYVYVEEDILVSGQKFTEGDYFTRNAFSFILRSGWNAVYSKIVSTDDSYTISIELKNPDHVVWIHDIWDEDYAGISDPDVRNAFSDFRKNRKMRFEEAQKN